jgi:hypothetical protein
MPPSSLSAVERLRNAIEAVTRWEFKPAIKDDMPLKAYVEVQGNFSLL